MRKKVVRSNMKKGFLSLLSKKNFLDITVTDVVNESKVARASFYRIYSSVDQVLDDIIKDFKEKVDKDIIPMLRSNDERLIKETLYDFFNKVKNNENGFVDVLPENIPFLFAKFEENALIGKNKVYHSIEEKYGEAISFRMALFIANLWRYYGYKETIDEMVNLVYSFVSKIH